MAVQRSSTQPEPVRVRLGRLLREARLAADLTQGAVAQRVGWPTSRICRIELGQRSLYMNELFALARALNVDASELLARLADKNSGDE